jgi:hypothetical protein
MLTRKDRDALAWLRWRWGAEYAVNCDGTIWTALPALAPGLVLSEPAATRLKATIYLDAACRWMRSGATAERWAHFTASPEQPPDCQQIVSAPVSSPPAVIHPFS